MPTEEWWDKRAAHRRKAKIDTFVIIILVIVSAVLSWKVSQAIFRIDEVESLIKKVEFDIPYLPKNAEFAKSTINYFENHYDGLVSASATGGIAIPEHRETLDSYKKKEREHTRHIYSLKLGTYSHPQRVLIKLFATDTGYNHCHTVSYTFDTSKPKGLRFWTSYSMKSWYFTKEKVCLTYEQYADWVPLLFWLSLSIVCAIIYCSIYEKCRKGK